jgi:hypothetical protein
LQEFPKDTWFDVYDYGLGDEVVWPHRVSLVRTGEKTYGATGTGKFAVALPPDCLWERLPLQAQGQPSRLAYLK